jgi:alginate O-acetyltransferase complex protein AlgI
LLLPTIEFVVFFVVVFGGSWRLAGRRCTWRLFMLAACYLFYSFWGWRFALLLAGMTAVADLSGRLLGAAPRRRRWLLATAVVVELLPLAFYKYYGFLALNLSALFGGSEAAAGLPFLQLAVPVGISFTTFRAISSAPRKEPHMSTATGCSPTIKASTPRTYRTSTESRCSCWQATAST